MMHTFRLFGLWILIFLMSAPLQAQNTQTQAPQSFDEHVLRLERIIEESGKWNKDRFDRFQREKNRYLNHGQIYDRMRLQTQNHPSEIAQSDLLPPFMPPIAHPEITGDIDIQEIDAHYYFEGFDFPNWSVQTVKIMPTRDISDFILLGYHFNFLRIVDLENPNRAVRFNNRGSDILVSVSEPLLAGQVYTFEFEGTLIFECQSLDCYLGTDSIVYLDQYGLILNGNYPQRDLFLLDLHFHSSDQSLSFSASGTSLNIEPCLEGICWHYESTIPNLLPAFVVLKTGVEQWNDWISLYPPVGADGDLIGSTTKEALAFYDQLYFPYPYGRINVVNMTDDLGVALGPMANVMFPASLWYDSDEFSSLYTQFVLAHELGHQYFFNWVKLSEISEPWMSEGFAEYSAQRFMENDLQNDIFRHMDYWEYMRNVPREEDPIINSPEMVASPYYFFSAYHKAANILQMIRQRIPSFDEVMRNYVRDFGLSFTSSSEFQTYLEQATGQSWQAFFDRWLYNAGYPIFDLQNLGTQASADGLGWETQLQITSTEKIYEPVPFICEVDGVSRVYVFESNVDQAILQIDCDGGAFDPNLDFLKRIRHLSSEDVDYSGVVDGIDLLMLYEKIENYSQFKAPYWSDSLDVTADQELNMNDFASIYQQIGRGLP